MEEQKYVIAIALAEQNKKRIMPLGGKTFSGVDTLSQSSKKEVEKIILDLLIRIFQRTTEGSLKISTSEQFFPPRGINLLLFCSARAIAITYFCSSI